MKKLYLTQIAVFICWAMGLKVSADVPAAAIYAPMIVYLLIGVGLLALGFAIYYFLKKRKK